MVSAYENPSLLYATLSEEGSRRGFVFAVHEASPAGPPKPRLLDRVRAALRIRHYSRRTEDTYVGWIRRYILFHGKRHPAEMGAPEVTRFLSALAVDGNVAASTQNQALSALLFLYREVLTCSPARVGSSFPPRSTGSTRTRAESGRGTGCSLRRASTLTG